MSGRRFTRAEKKSVKRKLAVGGLIRWVGLFIGRKSRGSAEGTRK